MPARTPEAPPEVPPEAPPKGGRTDDTRGGRLREVALLFLRLGTTAFGGPAAHIALMEDEVVRRRAWVSRQEFLDLLGATNLIPGPNSTEMAIHLGHRRAGQAGLIVAGACFILPAALITAGFAALYARYGTLPRAGALLHGVKPVIIAVVLQALVGLARSAVKGRTLGALGTVAVIAAALGINELLILLGAGLIAVAASRLAVPRAVEKKDAGASSLLPFGAASLLGSKLARAASPSLALAAAAGGAAKVPVSLALLFGTFVKIGSVLFGSGYVLLAFLRQDFVTRLGWLSEAQLLDAVAVGQVTPGPVFTTATFIGWQVGGAAGAVLATLGIFLPAFVFVALSGPLVPRIRESRIAGAFLDGVNVASLALMAVVTVRLARNALVDIPTVIEALLATALLLRYRVNSLWLVLAGALVGILSGQVAP